MHEHVSGGSAQASSNHALRFSIPVSTVSGGDGTTNNNKSSTHVQKRRAPLDLSILRDHIILSARLFGSAGDSGMRQDMRVVRM
jgi:hypothetical protein